MSLRLVVSVMMMISAAALGMIAFRLAAPSMPPSMAAATDGPIPPLEIGYFVAAHPLPPGTFVSLKVLAAVTAACAWPGICAFCISWARIMSCCFTWSSVKMQEVG